MNATIRLLLTLACQLLLVAVCDSTAFAQSTAPSSVQIQQSAPGFTVHGGLPGGMSYVAMIGSDGSLKNFGMGFYGMLDATVPGAPGGFVQQDGLISADKVEQHDASIVATSERASWTYLFSDHGVTIQLTNKTKSPLRYRMVPGVFMKHVITDGENAKAFTLPSETKTAFPTAITLAHTTIGLHITGDSENAGVLNFNHPMIDFVVPPAETKSMVLELKPLTADQRAKIAAAEAPAKVSEIDVISPTDYQVAQRSTKLLGQLRIGGRVNIDADVVEAKLNGQVDAKLLANVANGIETSGKNPVSAGGGILILGDKAEATKIRVDQTTHSFEATVTVPAGGWFKLELRALKNGKQVATTTVEHVGIGEVFIGAGQSNSTNCGDGGLLKTETGMVSTFGGTNWQLCEDPQPGVHDNTTMGSFWPAFGDAMYAKYHVPIGVAVTGHGGTSINQWHAGDELFNWTLMRMGQFGPGGFRALLWHQGESDTDMTTDEYRNGLANIIRDFKLRAGWDFPFFVAQATYHNPEAPAFKSVRDAQKALWDSGIAVEGPDTDTLVGDDRDQDGRGIHFSVKGRIAHGKLWAEKVAKYLDRWLAEK